MAKMVGLSRALKPEWLNKTADLALEGLSPDEVKTALNDYISFDIKSADNIRKAREILMNLWVYPFEDEKANQIRSAALEELHAGNTDKMAFHWCMMLLCYPVFVDVTGMIGKLISMQDSFSLAWLKEKMFEEWGERTTLFHSLDKIMQTLRQLQVLNSDRGIYTADSRRIESNETKVIMMKTILALGMKSYYEPAELTAIPQLFPFDFEISSELLFSDGIFSFGNFGGSPVLVG